MTELNASQKAMFKTFETPDPHSFGVFKMLQDLYPAFAQKIFSGNPFMKRIVMSGYNPMSILDYPICGRCETIASPDIPKYKNGKKHTACICFANKCGATTLDPITFKTWLKDELKHKAPPDIAENAEFVVDQIAFRMMKVAMQNLENSMKQQSFANNKKLGILMPDGSERQVDDSKKNKEAQEFLDSEIQRLKNNFKVEGD